MANALEEEFFRVEGRSLGVEACRYVHGLEKAPDGDRITAEERAALWYLAFWSFNGATSISVSALAMHIDRGTRETRKVLSFLIDKGILRSRVDPVNWRTFDIHEYEFVQLTGNCLGSCAG